MLLSQGGSPAFIFYFGLMKFKKTKSLLSQDTFMGNQPSLLSVLTEMCHRDGSTQLCSLICDQHHGEESNRFVVQHKPSKCYCFYKSLEIVTAAPVLEYLLPTANFSEKQYMYCLNLMVLVGNQLVDLTIHLFPEKN